MITKRIWRAVAEDQRGRLGLHGQRNGKQVRGFVGVDEEDAERAFSEVDDRGSSATDTGCGAGGMTFGAMVEKFLGKKRARASARFRTTRRQRAAAGVLSEGDAAGSHPHAPRGGVPDGATGDGVSLGRPLAPATVNREVALLRSILRMALAWDELERVPVFEMTKEQGNSGIYARRDHRLLAGAAESRSACCWRSSPSPRIPACARRELLRLIWDRVDFAVA